MEDFSEFAEFDEAILEAMFEDDYDDNVGESVPQHPDETSTTDTSQTTTGTVASTTGVATPSDTGAVPKRSRKKAIPRPKSTYTLETVLANKEALLLDSVTKVCEDDFINAPELPETPPVKLFADTCRNLIRNGSSTMAETIITMQVVLQLLWPAVHVADKHTSQTARNDASLIAWWKLRVGSVLKLTVRSMFQTLTGLQEVPSMFVQMIMRILYETLLVSHEKPPTKVPEANESFSLSSKEQNALRYVAGYIVARLPKKVAKHEERDGFMEVFSNMRRDSDKDTRLNFTREWVEARSRGGLTMVNDMTFLFFQVIEIFVKKHFPKNVETLRNVDIRLETAEYALKDRVVIDKWTLIAAPGDLSEKASLHLLQLVIDFYIQIRGFSFARNIVERHKTNTKAQKNSKGVRKTLKRAHEEAAGTDK